MLRFGRLVAIISLATGSLAALGTGSRAAEASVLLAQPILDVSAPAPGSSPLSTSGPYQASNASLLTQSLVMLQSPTSLDVLGVLHVFGVDARGHLMDLESTGPQTWRSSDITAQIGGPALDGAVTATSFVPGQVAIFGEGAGPLAGHLISYSTSPLSGNLWVAIDLSAATQMTQHVQPGPSITVDPGGVVHLEATTDTGHLIDVAASPRGSWQAVDVTAGANLPAFSGVATVTSCPGASACAFGHDAAHHLIEYIDHAGAWASRDLSRFLSIGTIAGDPTAQAAGPYVVVAAPRTDGGLQVLVSSDPQFSPKARFRATPSFAVPGGAAAEAPSMVPVPSGLLVALRSKAGHLVDQVLYGLARVASGPPATDVTASMGGTQLATSRVSAVVVGSALHQVEGTTSSSAPTTGVLGAGQILVRTQQLTSPNGVYQAILQGDGNFGVYAHAFGLTSLVFNAAIVKPGADAMYVANNGRLRFVTSSGTVLRSYGPLSTKRTSLMLSNSGMLALVSPTGDVLWSVGGTLGDLIVAKARTQLGVGENPPGSNCNPYTASFGRGSTSGCAPGTAAEAWCSDFADWVWLNEGADVGGITGWSYTFVDYGLAHGTFKPGPLNDPQPGDAVVWGTMAGAGYGAHVGIVTDVRYGYIRVLSGNSGTDNVSESDWLDAATFTIDGYNIVGYTSPVATLPSASVRRSAAVAPGSSMGGITQAMIDSQDGGH
jgi:CHAP domain